MIFSSGLFAVFFIIVFATYWGLRTRRARHLFLLGASYIFYMSWNPLLIFLIIGTTIWDYGVARALEKITHAGRRKLILLASIVVNLGVLSVFKYADFFILSLRNSLEAFGIHAQPHTLAIILPLGISFYTFQAMSYTIDVYRRVIPAMRSFVDFSFYITFFPHLVAGPIVKAKDFLPQLTTIKRFDWHRIDSGALLFMIGLTKKVLIADQLAQLVDPVFADPTRYTTRDLWLAMFCYGGQIYCDFSGYTDMAIAVARVLGFDLLENFANPYLATSLVDFWRRWHISLSTWLREYLYIPLGGSHGGKWKTYRNLIITMLLGGLWHGASWTFVVWGAIHGVALAINKMFTDWRRLLPLPVGEGWGEGRLPLPVGKGRGEVSTPSPLGEGGGEGRPPLLVGEGWGEGRLPLPAGEGGGEGWRRSTSSLPRTILCWAVTLLLVHIAWVFFRCQPVTAFGASEPEPTIVALQRAAYFVTHLFVTADPVKPLWLMSKVPMLMLLAIMFMMQVYNEWTRRGRPALRLPAPVAGMGYALWLLALVIFSPDNISPFIYFQF